jgi:hypothetical protein
MENQQKNYENFASRFAKTIVAGDFTTAHQYLAPWLQAEMSSAELKAAIEERLLDMNGYWELEELIYPAEFSVDGNGSTIESLKETMSWREPRRFSDELTRENFRQWMVIQFMPDENDERIEFDAWFDLWFVVAEVDEELKIGFFEFEDPD